MDNSKVPYFCMNHPVELLQLTATFVGLNRW